MLVFHIHAVGGDWESKAHFNNDIWPRIDSSAQKMKEIFSVGQEFHLFIHEHILLNLNSIFYHSMLIMINPDNSD